jgi:hypothetical protein
VGAVGIACLEEGEPPVKLNPFDRERAFGNTKRVKAISVECTGKSGIVDRQYAGQSVPAPGDTGRRKCRRPIVEVDEVWVPFCICSGASDFCRGEPQAAETNVAKLTP